MEHLTVNLSGLVRRAALGGREYIVAPASLIVADTVLNGSMGPLLYPGEEVRSNPRDWNGMPIVIGHPKRGDAFVSARSPDVADKWIGFNFNTSANGKLKSELWFDVERANAADMRIVQKLEAGEPFELSTGLFTSNQPAKGVANGVEYSFVARNYKPDHIAVLLDDVGACSVVDGCGVNVNVRSQNTGRFKPHGSGTGKGEVHEHAQAGALVVTEEDQRLGADGADPSWAADADKWEKAKKSAAAGGHENDWPHVVAIYRSIGGKVSSAALETNMALSQDGRKSVIDSITANCGYFKGNEGALQKLSDEELVQLQKSSTPATNANKALNEYSDDELKAEMDKRKPKPKEKEKEKEPASNMDAWLKLAPAEAKEVWNSAVDTVETAKAELIDRIVNANAVSDEAKAKLKPIYSSMSLATLKTLAANIKETEKEEHVSNRFGAYPVDSGSDNGNAEDPYMPPTLNMLELASPDLVKKLN